MEERDIMDVDVLFVGGGVACLSGALHLTNLIKKHNEQIEQNGEGKKLDEIMVAVLEKVHMWALIILAGASWIRLLLKSLSLIFWKREHRWKVR